MQRESVELHCASSYKSIVKKHRSFPSNFTQAFTLLNQQLCPAKTAKPLGSKYLIHLHEGEGFQVWKYHVMTQGLKPNQWPRMWVGVNHKLDMLVPLELDLHGNNYSDNALEKRAIEAMAKYCLEMSED